MAKLAGRKVGALVLAVVATVGIGQSCEATSNVQHALSVTAYDGIVPRVLSYDGIVPRVLSYDGIVPRVLSYDGIVPRVLSYDGIVPRVMS